jgi:hypothetical protein
VTSLKRRRLNLESLAANSRILARYEEVDGWERRNEGRGGEKRRNEIYLVFPYSRLLSSLHLFHCEINLSSATQTIEGAYADFLSITDPTLVTPQDAEKFVTTQRDERINMTHMRDSLCGGLIHLGAALHSSQVIIDL